MNAPLARPAVAAMLLLAACAGGHREEAPTELSQAASWLRDYIRIDTTETAGEAGRAVDFLAGLLNRGEIDVEILDAGDGRPSLWAYLPATADSEPAETLLLLHHLDVVDPGSRWRVPPFSGDVVDGELWGRGAVDSKSLGIAHLAALVDLSTHGAPRRRSIALLAAADEERGGRLGVGRWIEQRSDLLGRVTTVVNEGGINRGYEGRLHWWGVEVAQKRPLWLEVSAQPEPLIAGLGRLLDRPYRWRVCPEAVTTFARMAPHYNEHWQRIFLDLERYVQPTGPTVMLLPGMESFFLDSIQINSLELAADGQARAQIDIRLLPDTDQDDLLSEVEAALGPEVTTRVLLEAPQVEASPWGGSWIDTLATQLGAVAPVVPQMASGTTDSRYFRELGIPAYGFSPFILNSEFTRAVHSRDERIPLAEFDAGVDRMKRLVRTWAAGAAASPQLESEGEASAGAGGSMR